MDKRKLFLSIVALSIFYVGCTDETPKETKKPAQTTELKEKVTEVKVKEITKVIAPIESVIQKANLAPNGVTLYKKCVACHGKNAEKSALSKSKIIKDWEVSKIAEALKGYRDGTYGGTMKGLMIAQVVNLSDKEIDALSEHIANFN